MKTRSISVNKAIYNRPIENEDVDSQKGIHIELFLPPSDIPEFLQHKYDEVHDILFIDFKYAIQEKIERLFEKEGISLWIGKESGKPFYLQIKNIKKDKIDAVQLRNIFYEELPSISKDLPVRKKTNLERAKEFIGDKADDLVGV